MKLKSQKGYSLIEIAVGILILTIFLICSAALFNGCYNTYRMIQQRNLAVNFAVSNMETMLQTDSDILTGFFVLESGENLSESGNFEYNYVANTQFEEFVLDNFDSDFKSRYARLNNLDIADVKNLSDEDYQNYIDEDTDFLINSFIQKEVSLLTDDEKESGDIKNGNYGLLVPSIQETGNQALLYPGSGTPSEIQGEMAVRKTITRLPLTDSNAYGNKVLKLKVEVLFTNKIKLENLTEKDVQSIVLESIKISG